MNTYLIDTHILLWWLFNDKRLTKNVRELIIDPDNHLFVSSVSIWEIMIKKSLNKLEAPDNLQEVLDENGIECLPMTIDHALLVQHLPTIHNDPFDRLIIAQCIVEDLILVTADKLICKYNIKCF